MTSQTRDITSAALDHNTRAIAGLRIAVGLLFIIFGQYKVFGAQFTLGGGFDSWILRFLERGAYPFMVPVLRDFVQPTGRPLHSSWPMESWPSAWPLCSVYLRAWPVYGGASICWHSFSRQTIQAPAPYSGSTSAPLSII